MPDQVVVAPEAGSGPRAQASGRRGAPASRRRRVVALLVGAAAASGSASLAVPALSWLAIALLVLTIAYVGAAQRVHHLAVRREMATAFGAPDGGFDWGALAAPERARVTGDELDIAAPAASAAAAGGGPPALLRFVAAYLLGWVLTPAAVAIHLLAGDRRDLEGDGALARIVALQRSGRAHSLRALAVSMAASAGVTAVGGVTGLLASPVASAAPAPGSYVVVAGDTLAGIAAAHATTVAHLAALNHLADVDLIYPGQVLLLGPAATAGAPSPAPVTQAARATYTVRSGDTLGSIAASTGTTWEALAAANHLADPNLIMVGEVLVVGPQLSVGHQRTAPAPSAPEPATLTGARTYTVRSGDTLGSIASRWGTSWEALAVANHIADPNLITVGEVIVLGAPAPPATGVATPSAPAAPAPAPRVPAAPAPAAPATAAPAPTGSVGAGALAVALRQIGKPYQWAGAGPDTFDCSGLVRYAYAAVGVSLDHYTVSQYDETARIDESQLQPGDLVFYGGSAPSHVAMYAGEGNVVTADTTGTPVRVEPLTWDGTPSGFGRVG